jgi:hypothetical protein
VALFDVDVNIRDLSNWPPPGCRVIATFKKVLGINGVLLDTDSSTAAGLQSRPDVHSIEPAGDGPYIDTDTGRQYEVRGGRLV